MADVDDLFDCFEEDNSEKETIKPIIVEEADEPPIEESVFSYLEILT